MSFPENPNTIVLQNEFYPKGLREIDIWNYYQKNKDLILRETAGRNVVFAILTDINKPIIRRKLTGQQLIQLTSDNYDRLITGRTITIYSEMRSYEDFIIIDIDVDPNFEGIKWARKVTLDVYDYLMNNISFISSVKIKFTGKTSFHLLCYFGKKIKVDVGRFLIERELRKSPLSKVYTVSYKRTAGVPNLDLSPNKSRGIFTTLYSLSIYGLKCVEVPYRDLFNFNPKRYRI